MAQAKQPWETEKAPAPTPEEKKEAAKAEANPDTASEDTASEDTATEKTGPAVVTSNDENAKKMDRPEDANSSEGKVLTKGKGKKSERVVIGGQQASLALISLVSSGMSVAEARKKLEGK